MSAAVRPDAGDKARGRLTYGTDLEVPEMLWGALLLAPVAHGRIRSIDLAPARGRPGVVAIGAADLPALLPGPPTDADRPIFPGSEILYRAQPIAAVAAPTLAAAREAVRAIRVEVEGLPVAESIEEAPVGEAPAVIAHVRARHGDVDAEFSRADLVLTETYRTSGVCQVALEPHAAVADILPDGRWRVRTSTQSPFGAREDLAALLGIPEERIVVQGTWVGGGFGGKGAALVEPYALLLARASGRPVRLALTYHEEFRLGRSTLPTLVRIASSVRRGRLTARRVLWRLDAGASLPGRDFATGYGIGFLAGPYRVGAVELEGFALRTNKPPLGPHRAPLAPQCAFVVESHMDHLAEKLGTDSGEFRRAHAWVEGDRTHLGQPVGPFGLAACFERANALARRWRAERRPGEGVGIGAGFWSTGTGAGGEAKLFLAPTGLTILQGEPEIGSGSVVRGLGAVAEEVTGLPRERIAVEYAPTSEAPFDSGVWGSRTVGALGQAVEKGARQILEELARRIGGRPSGTIRLVVDGPSLAAEAADGRRRPVAELLTPEERTGRGLAAHGRHYGTSGTIDDARVLEGTFYPYTDFTGAVHVAHVAVDRETGGVRVLRYAAFHDIGHLVDRPTARAQVEGGVVMGIGTALTEEAIWSADGTLENPFLVGYRIPTLAEAPPIEVEFVPGFPGAGPFGAKGLGEPPIIPVPAAIAHAIRDATGIAPMELPMTGERLARALKIL